MLTTTVLLTIVAGLIFSSLAGLPVLYPLCAGLFALCLVCVYYKIEIPVLWRMLLLDIKLPLNSLFVFLAIGAVTASWRASGTIAMIITYGAGLIHPRLFILACFWLSAVVSLLLGTAFGTTGTVGLTLIVMAKAGGVNLPLVAGAIISGVFVGDVASPMSSSTNLIAIMTKSDIHHLIGRLIRSVFLPFGIVSLLFAFLSWEQPLGLMDSALIEEMTGAFAMNAWVLLPAAVVLLLMLVRVRVSRAITASCVAAALVAWLVQGQAPLSVAQAVIFGFVMPEGSPLKVVMDGGGIASMLNSEMILIVSALYSGLFKGTGMLAPVKGLVRRVAGQIGPGGGTTLAAFLTCLFAPSQVFAVMLTNQFAAPLYDLEKPGEREQLAFGIASTAMMFSPLVPWNICSTVPAAMMGVDGSYIPFVFYPMAFSFCYLVRSWIDWKKAGMPPVPQENKAVDVSLP